MSLIAKPPRLLVKRGTMPTPPAELAEEVENYARDWGRHAVLRFVPILLKGPKIVRGCWVARFRLKPNDPRLQMYQKGRVEEEPAEDVWFHVVNPRRNEPGEPEYLPLDIVQMGASGVRQFLERGNMWGRGEYSSLTDQLLKTRKASSYAADARYEKARERNCEMVRDRRRSLLKIPFFRVGIDLKNKKIRRTNPSPAK